MKESEAPAAIEPAPEADLEQKTVREKIESDLAEAGLAEKLDPDKIDRLVLTESYSEFNNDSRMISRGIGKILTFLSEHDPEFKLSPERLADARVAAMVHDIGKTGPADATPDEQVSVIRVYSLEQVVPTAKVGDVVRNSFGVQAETILSHLQSCGVGPEATMRQFWDAHGRWTYDIIKDDQHMSGRSKVIAASHHIDRGIDPYGLKDKVPQEARIIGAMEDYLDIVEQRALIAVDKYQAAVRRSRSAHEVAMGRLKAELGSGIFRDDKVMGLIMDAIDNLGKDGQLFS